MTTRSRILLHTRELGHRLVAQPPRETDWQQNNSSYFPDLNFTQCRLFRGIIPQRLIELQAGEEEAVVMMWHKNAKANIGNALKNDKPRGIICIAWFIEGCGMASFPA